MVLQAPQAENLRHIVDSFLASFPSSHLCLGITLGKAPPFIPAVARFHFLKKNHSESSPLSLVLSQTLTSDPFHSNSLVL